MRALIIDDDEDIRRIAEVALGDLGGFDVVVATTGAEGLERARRGAPDVILLDLTLPDRDGGEVLRDLQADAATRAAPVLLLTARDDEAEIRALLGAGARGIIPKPFHAPSLASTVRELMASPPSPA